MSTPRPSTPAKETREQNSEFGSPAGEKIRSGQDDPREPEAMIGNPPGVSGSQPFASPSPPHPHPRRHHERPDIRS